MAQYARYVESNGIVHTGRVQHGKLQDVPGDPQILDLPRIEDARRRLDRLTQRRRLGVEVDPHTPTPRIALNRGEAHVIRVDVVLRKRLTHRDLRVAPAARAANAVVRRLAGQICVIRPSPLCHG